MKVKGTTYTKSISNVCVNQNRTAYETRLRKKHIEAQRSNEINNLKEQLEYLTNLVIGQTGK